MPNSNNLNTGDHTYGFNGKEKDDAVSGIGNHYDYGYRNYNPRLAKFLSVDPLSRNYPFYSPYVYSGNMPIWTIDLDGLQPVKRTFLYKGTEYTFRTNLKHPQKFSLNSKGNRKKSFSLLSETHGRTSLDLLRSRHSQKLKNRSADRRKIESAAHGGIGLFELVNEMLAENPDISLVIVGNHKVNTKKQRIKKGIRDPQHLYTTDREHFYSSEDDRDDNIDGQWSLQRADFIKESFFENLENIETYSRYDVERDEFNNMDLGEIGGQARGITMGFNLNNAATHISGLRNVINSIGNLFRSAPVREVYHSVRILCFAEGTKILMGDGASSNIEDVKLGDEILNYNSTLNKVEKDVVTKIDKAVQKSLVKVKFDNSIENTNTEDHPYLVKDKGWCSFNPEKTMEKFGFSCSKLEVGDECYSYDKSNNNLILVELIDIMRVDKQITTYNLTGLKKNSNYFANGIVVSNETNSK